MLTVLAVAGYRSLRNLVVPLGQLNLITGPNGSGKSSLYRAPELMALREQVRRWRFYDHVRTDAESPARLPQTGTRTMAMSGDGRDMAAAIQTIFEIGDREAV